MPSYVCETGMCFDRVVAATSRTACGHFMCDACTEEAIGTDYVCPFCPYRYGDDEREEDDIHKHPHLWSMTLVPFPVTDERISYDDLAELHTRVDRAKMQWEDIECDTARCWNRAVFVTQCEQRLCPQCLRNVMNGSRCCNSKAFITNHVRAIDQAMSRRTVSSIDWFTLRTEPMIPLLLYHMNGMLTSDEMCILALTADLGEVALRMRALSGKVIVQYRRMS